MPRTGAYQHKITIETPTSTTDSYGQPVKTWATHAQVYAAVEPLRGREYFASAQINAEITARIRTHHLSTVTEDMRVSFDGRTYNIQAIINPQERGREMHLMCSEGVNNG